MATTKKIESVEKITAKLAKTKSLIFVDYRGLKHKQLEELRRLLKTVGGEIMIVKNRLMLRAIGTHADSVRQYLTNTSASLFSYTDEVSALKSLTKFLKKAGAGTTKGGLLAGVQLSPEGVERLAVLPDRMTLLGNTARQLMAPVQGLHRALSWNINSFVWALTAIKNSKSSN